MRRPRKNEICRDEGVPGARRAYKQLARVHVPLRKVMRQPKATRFAKQTLRAFLARFARERIANKPTGTANTQLTAAGVEGRYGASNQSTARW